MTHLTEDQLTDLVIEGAPSAESRAHLAVCDACRARVEQELAAFGASMVHFNQASLAWTEAQPRRAQATASPRSSLSLARRFAPALLALAVAEIAVVTLPVWHHDARPAPTSNAAPQDSPAQIAADNALLQDVNVALAANEPSPLEEYHLLDAAAPASKAKKSIPANSALSRTR